MIWNERNGVYCGVVDGKTVVVIYPIRERSFFFGMRTRYEIVLKFVTDPFIVVENVLKNFKGYRRYDLEYAKTIASTCWEVEEMQLGKIKEKIQ